MFALLLLYDTFSFSQYNSITLFKECPFQNTIWVLNLNNDPFPIIQIECLI